MDELGVGSEVIKESFVVAVEAALALNDRERAEALLSRVEALPLGRLPQFLRAQVLRFRATLEARDHDADAADRHYRGATALFREIAFPFYVAVTELEHGEWLAGENRSGEAGSLLAEARQIFERLGARPWLERAARATLTAREPEVVSS